MGVNSDEHYSRIYILIKIKQIKWKVNTEVWAEQITCIQNDHILV